MNDMIALYSNYFDDPDDANALTDVNANALAVIEHALFVIVNYAPIERSALIDVIDTMTENVRDLNASKGGIETNDVDLPDFCRDCAIDYDAMTPDERALHVCEGEHIIVTCERRYNAIVG